MKLFFDPTISGHHIEFNINLIQEAARVNENIVFVVGYGFRDLVIKKYHLSAFLFSEGVEIIQLSYIVMRLLKVRNRILRSVIEYLCLRYFVFKIKPNEVILLYVNSLLRVLSIIPAKFRIKAILFDPVKFLAPDNNRRNRRFHSLIRRNNFVNVFILNDSETVIGLNSIYDTKVFTYLSDPIKLEDSENMKTERSNAIVLLFLGVITKRKGIMNVVESLINAEWALAEKMEVKIVGKIDEKYNAQFLDEISALPSCDKIKIRLKNEFVSKKEFISELINCDYLMQTYKDSNASSGILGYGQLYSKNIIGTEDGYIGSVLKKYEYGIPIKVDQDSLIDFFSTMAFEKSGEIEANRNFESQHSFSVFFKMLTT